MTGLVDQDGVAQFSELSGSAPCVISSACPAGWGIGSTGSGSWNTLWKQQYVPFHARRWLWIRLGLEAAVGQTITWTTDEAKISLFTVQAYHKLINRFKFFSSGRALAAAHHPSGARSVGSCALSALAWHQRLLGDSGRSAAPG